MIHIVLIHPKMPSNTGNIIRLCANTGASLHLLRPLGFDLDDKKLRRAGLDYHEYANLQVYDDWQTLRDSLQSLSCQHMVALTTKRSRPFYEYDFNASNSNTYAHANANNTTHPNANSTNGNSTNSNNNSNVALVFGSETAGLPEEIRQDIGEKNWLRLPMLPDSRSLNLSNSVAVCLYEVWRQQGFSGDVGMSTGYHV